MREVIHCDVAARDEFDHYIKVCFEKKYAAGYPLVIWHFMRPVFTSLNKEHPNFVRGLGLRIATWQWATGRKIAVEAVARPG